MVSTKHLKKGDLLVKEGETSNSMYWVQNGTLRLFKKKGNGVIELGTVKAGEVVGELSFLDNLPRSASVEATEQSDVVVIPRGNFEEIINTQPSWLKSLVQTLVKRLRSTNNRVKELEGSSQASGDGFKAEGQLSNTESMRLCSAVLLAASRNGEASAEGKKKIKSGWVQFYGSQIFGVPAVKVQPFVDAITDLGVVRAEKQGEHLELHLLDLERLEKYIYFAHEESGKPEDKQLALSPKGMAILQCVWEFSGVAGAGGEELLEIDMEQVYKKAVAKTNTPSPFEWASFEELVKAGLSQPMKMGADKKPAVIHAARVVKVFPLMAFRQRVREAVKKA